MEQIPEAELVDAPAPAIIVDDKDELVGVEGAE